MFVNYVIAVLFIIIGVILIFPGGGEPICTVCGFPANFLLGKAAAFIYVALGGYSLYTNYQSQQKSVK